MDQAAITLAGLGGLVAIAVKVIDFLRMLANAETEKSGIVTQLAAWLGATAVVFLYGASQLGDFVLPGTDILLENADSPTKVLLGLAVGSGASLLVDFKQAIDKSDSAAKPTLL